MSPTLMFLCTHANIGVSAVYKCSYSLKPYVHQLYSSSLGKYVHLFGFLLEIEVHHKSHL